MLQAADEAAKKLDDANESRAAVETGKGTN
jgi:hypothetical protein